MKKTLRQLFNEYPIDVEKCTWGMWNSCPLGTLAKTIHPIGETNRTQVRKVLEDYGIPFLTMRDFYTTYDRATVTGKSSIDAFKEALDSAEPQDEVDHGNAP